MFWSGRAKRASTEADWAETGVRARFLVGRWERGSAEVGIDSGPSPDILGEVEGGLRKAFVMGCGLVLRCVSRQTGYELR